MKLRISVFNKTEVVTAFVPEAFKIGELFGCAVQIKCEMPMLGLPRDLNLVPVKTGKVTELEISVQGDEEWEALSAIRRCMSQCFSAINYQVN